MSAWLRQVAPAGAPIGVTDLARWALIAASSADVGEGLRDAVCERFGVRHAFLTSTGRAGLTLLLRALRRLAPSGRDEVILPSYTCYSVAASVVKAGLRPRIVDVSPDTLDYDREDLEAADTSRVLAIVATNLYGYPNDMPALAAIARERGVFLIDDAAQAMGASVGGRPCGTWGDAGLFSLDKGKNVSAIDGGVLVTGSDEVAAVVRDEVAALPAPSRGESARGIVKALAYSALLRPWLYWMPYRIPQLGLGQTVFTTEFPLDRPSRALSALAVAMLRRLDHFTVLRTANAGALLGRLETMPSVRTIAPVPGATPVYLRLPVLIDDSDARARAFASLRAHGIGATGSYPASLADVPELRGRIAGSTISAIGGRYVARHVVTLPTHAFVTPRDVARMADALTAHGVDAEAAAALTT